MSIAICMNTILFEFLSVLPFRIFAVCLFGKSLRIPLWTAVTATAVLQFVQAAVITAVIRSPYPVTWAHFGFGLIFFLFLFLCLGGDRWPMLYSYIFILDYEITAQGISKVFDALVFDGPGQPSDMLPAALVTFALFAASAPFVTHFLKKTNEKTSGIQEPFFWRTVWMLPAINTLIVLMNTNESARENLIRPRYLTSRLLLFLSMFLVFIIFTRVLDVSRREAALKERTAKQEEFMAAERARQEQLERYVLEMRRVRHDQLQHLVIIRSFLENEDYGKLKDYLEQYEASIPKSAPKIWCSNHAANIMLSYYAGECQSHRITFEAETSLPEKLAFSEPDICSILGNLLENALTACTKISEGQPTIKLKAQADNRQFILVVDNTCDAPPQMDGDVFLSTKHSGAGIGTASVRSVAEKYHGWTDFRYEDHVFYSSVLLFAPEADPSEHAGSSGQ
ncbi:MAG: GHKL domain-containing protein [Clostridiales bacterium]|nr:GHKL domain-containing protein [Clostridiales bacterium]